MERGHADSIRDARWPDDGEAVDALLREYAQGLGVDLSFQGFAAELAGLPGAYARPRGCFLLALVDGAPVGCVGLRPRDGGDAEMKRLYLRPAARGHALGRRLVERVCAEAQAIGYRRVLLDTLPTMQAARELYRSLGFEAVAPYTHNPVEGTSFLAKLL
jgi:ribosomal protein S18 acetylase RimI-like enzyme